MACVVASKSLCLPLAELFSVEVVDSVVKEILL